MTAPLAPAANMAALPEPNCPLCGGPNACAPACSGTLETPCWCRTASFPTELLARVPPDQRNRACICAACANAACADQSAAPTRAPARPAD